MTDMNSLVETIMKHIQTLAESKQIEIFDFVEYLRSKVEKQEIKDWTDFSLSSAMRGIADEETPYSFNDLKELFS